MSRTLTWIDTHCHLDAPQFDADATSMRARASEQGVRLCVIPAVETNNFDVVRKLAHTFGDAYALGIHPLYVPQAQDADLRALEAQLLAHRNDPRLVAVGEIGLDFFVPALCTPTMRVRQLHFYRAQLRLAHQHGLPVLLHVRKSADLLLKGLRDIGGTGIAHAFNGSAQQAQAFVNMGFKLGFGGAVTFEPALQLRRLASELPLDALVLETDAPDIPPHWLYQTAAQRSAGAEQGRNEPAELPRIGSMLAALRGMDLATLADVTTANACAALPKLGALLEASVAAV